MASIGFSPDFVLFQEQANSKPFKEILPFLPTHGSGHGMSRSSIIVSHEQNGLHKLRSELHRCNQFASYLAMRRMSLTAEYQDMHNDYLLSSVRMNDQWTNRKEFLEFLMSRSSDLKEDYSGPSMVSELRELQAMPTDMHLKDVASIKFQLDNCFGVKESFHHASRYSYNQETDYDFVHDSPHPSVGFHSEERLSVIDNIIDMKDLGTVLAEFAVVQDSNQCTKTHVLVPHFTWSNAVDLQDHVYPSSVMLETVTASPLKSPKKLRQKSATKRKTKKAMTERNLYRNTSLHAFETILSLMVDKKRNGKTMMNSLKKSSPELPQLLTQVSASITGIGLSVMFSVVYKVACGTSPVSTSNLLTTGFGVGLFWLSCSVNKLRNTIIYICKNFSKTGFEENGMMSRVDESVKAIFFRVSALMMVLLLRFA